MSEKIIKKIHERGYYEFRLKPKSEVSELSFQRLEEIVRKNQVRHRGVYYPHIADHEYGKFSRIENYLESYHHWGEHLDIWRFYKSGQFKELLCMREDRWDDHPPLFVKWNESMQKSRLEPKFLEPIMTILSLTEFFLFAYRLSVEDKLSKDWEIAIQLHDCKDRILQIRIDNRVPFDRNYVSNTDIIKIKKIETTSEQLSKNHDDYAITAALQIFDYFGWNNPSIPTILKQEQKEFYKWKF